MRLRNLRKLEEMEIRQEDKALAAERKKLKDLIGSETEQWKRIADEVKEVRAKFGPKTPLGKRRTTFAQAPVHDWRRSRRRWSSASRSRWWSRRKAGSVPCAER
jgi:topoisomerase-4 subunit A